MVGKAQQAYAGLSVTDASDYGQLKPAILRWYNITEESYRQHFRAAKPRAGESNREVAARLEDLAGKWMKTCTSIEELRDLMVLEQLLNTLPEDAHIFKERKPKTSMEAGRLADDYIAARNDEVAEKGEEEETLIDDYPSDVVSVRNLGTWHETADSPNRSWSKRRTKGRLPGSLSPFSHGQC